MGFRFQRVVVIPGVTLNFSNRSFDLSTKGLKYTTGKGGVDSLLAFLVLVFIILLVERKDHKSNSVSVNTFYGVFQQLSLSPDEKS